MIDPGRTSSPSVVDPSEAVNPPEVPHGATTTGIWFGGAGSSPARESASAAFDILAHGLPPLPLCAQPTSEAWGADAIGRGVSLLTELHVDRVSYGWRLTSAAGKDERMEASDLGEAFDAMAEYGEGFDGAIQISLPGPWTLVAALSSSAGSPVLADHGARRDVIQAYAFGIAEFAAKFSRLGMSPVIRLIESSLASVLTGTVPTASGWQTLPAINENQVYAGLQSTLSHLPPVLLSLPDFTPLHLQGKEITATEVVKNVGAGAVSVPLASLKAREWEQLAMIAEAGVGAWLQLPPNAGSRPTEVQQWSKAITGPWARIGMGATTLHDFGVLTGEELPLTFPPLLTGDASENIGRGNMILAAGLRRALEEIE